jgi:hypothetical protein
VPDPTALGAVSGTRDPRSLASALLGVLTWLLLSSVALLALVLVPLLVVAAALVVVLARPRGADVPAPGSSTGSSAPARTARRPAHEFGAGAR